MLLSQCCAVDYLCYKTHFIRFYRCMYGETYVSPQGLTVVWQNWWVHGKYSNCDNVNKKGSREWREEELSLIWVWKLPFLRLQIETLVVLLGRNLLSIPDHILVYGLLVLGKGIICSFPSMVVHFRPPAPYLLTSLLDAVSSVWKVLFCVGIPAHLKCQLLPCALQEAFLRCRTPCVLYVPPWKPLS